MKEGMYLLIIKNEYIKLDEETTTLKITSIKYGEFDILIDTKSINKCKECQWSIMHAHSNQNRLTYYYVYNNKNGLLHRYLMDNPPKDKLVDHISGDTLDNRLSNLQLCTRKQNRTKARTQSNSTSGHSGVCWNKKTQSWMASVRPGAKFVNLGYFDDINDAIKVRENAEDLYYGKEYVSIERNQ